MNDFTEILQQLSEGADLSPEQADFALREIIAGNVNGSRTAAFLYGMRCKGETVDELSALVGVMRGAAVAVDVNTENAVDLCGTGGDRSGTFNISTAAMFVVAGAEVPVLKHGNSGVSSRSGSFDVLKALGVHPDLNKEQVETCFRETGMAFMFAPLFHPAMARVMNARKELGLRTFFNIMGPLLNPAGVTRQVAGAYDAETARMMARILGRLGTDFAYTVHSDDGLDEFSTTSGSRIFLLNGNGEPQERSFDPRTLGMELTEIDQLKGGTPEENADIIRAILDDRATDAQQDIVLLNATFAIHASGLCSDIQDALLAARESLESGEALNALNRFAECTTDLAS
ncbi:anthranilate phosphoribosyltransferase [Balneolales bacterium ANBcel1]|nr:anthranilate phosphoribosyltransferase [Balneolales bacterium ANBcel1]